MAIKPVCDKYKEELTDAGGLVFEPPDENDEGDKFHLCKRAWDEFVIWYEIKGLYNNPYVLHVDEVGVAYQPPKDITSAGPSGNKSRILSAVLTVKLKSMLGKS